ncbi:MAG: metalloregulator ArsR/SmtB family transcription factor [Mariprofundaceae bacterium]
MTNLNQQVLIFKALGDPLRLRIMHLLTQYEELCVCHITDALEMPQSSISRHLSSLKQANLVKVRRDGKWMHYNISDDDLSSKLGNIILESTDSRLKADLIRLNIVLSD